MLWGRSFGAPTMWEQGQGYYISNLRDILIPEFLESMSYKLKAIVC